ncbi:MAG: LysM domain-containing protein [Verrucomicrobiota bacterium]
MKPFCHSAAILLTLLSFAPCLFAAVDDDDPWSKFSARLDIGHVTLQLTNQEIHVTGSNLNVTLAWPMPLVQDYVCAVRNPFAQPTLEDGFVQNDKSWCTLQGYDDFKTSAFSRFAFFSARPTTIGLLTGHAAANGDSVQKLLLVDVETGAHVLIPLDSGKIPQWLEQAKFPPAFVTHRQMGYKGWHRSCFGQAYRFKDGCYQRDMVTEQRLLSQKFHDASLSSAQRQALCAASQGVLDDWGTESNLAQALGDFVYYGTRTGSGKVVDDLLSTLPPELRLSLSQLRQIIYSESRTNVVTGTVAPAPDPLGDGIAAPRIVPTVHRVRRGETIESIAKELGVSVEQLHTNNPYTNPKRLKTGETLHIYERWDDQRIQAEAQRGGMPQAELARWIDQTAIWSVQRGDSGIHIARKFYMNFKTLAAANPGVDWQKIKVGQTILIPRYGWNWESPTSTNYVVVHKLLELRVELAREAGIPQLIKWQPEQTNLWSLTYCAGSRGTNYTFDVIRKALINLPTSKVVADEVFQYQNLKGQGTLPEQPTWTWTTNALVIHNPETGVKTIPLRNLP